MKDDHFALLLMDEGEKFVFYMRQMLELRRKRRMTLQSRLVLLLENEGPAGISEEAFYHYVRALWELVDDPKVLEQSEHELDPNLVVDWTNREKAPPPPGFRHITLLNLLSAVMKYYQSPKSARSEIERFFKNTRFEDESPHLSWDGEM